MANKSLPKAFVKISHDNKAEVEKVFKLMGFKSTEHFLEETGVTMQDIIGCHLPVDGTLPVHYADDDVFIYLCNNRVFRMVKGEYIDEMISIDGGR